MTDLDSALVFLGASMLLLIAPGPAILYVVAESLGKGRRSGVIASAGLTAGNLVHVVGATAGLSALLATSALAFGILRYLGAAYLLYLGCRQIRRRWRSRHDGSQPPAAPGLWAGGEDATAQGEPWRTFRRGLLVNVLNPKIALFFLAFFPQFVDPFRGSATLQVVVLGVAFALLTLLVDVAYALAVGSAADFLRRGRRRRRSPVARVAGYLPGVVYIGLGLAAALAPVERR